MRIGFLKKVSIKGCSWDLRFRGPYHNYDTLLGFIILELCRAGPLSDTSIKIMTF